MATLWDALNSLKNRGKQIDKATSQAVNGRAKSSRAQPNSGIAPNGQGMHPGVDMHNGSAGKQMKQQSHPAKTNPGKDFINQLEKDIYGDQ